MTYSTRWLVLVGRGVFCKHGGSKENGVFYRPVIDFSVHHQVCVGRFVPGQGRFGVHCGAAGFPCFQTENNQVGTLYHYIRRLQMVNCLSASGAGSNIGGG